MKKIFIMLLISIACKSQLWAQHYITAGMEFNSMILDSDGLDQFKETYNMVNEPYLARLMNGMGIVNGVRGEIGYRYLGRLGKSFAIGYERSIGKDGVRYHNGETRNLKLIMSSLYVEGEIGHTHKRFFINGLITAFLNRKISLESIYDGPPSEVAKKLLNGTYKCDTSISTDVGIVIGYFREPIILSTKITYPIFSRGGSDILMNEIEGEIATKSDKFPNDFIAYCNDDPYDGVACDDIDGLKILISVAFAMQILK